MCQGLFWPNYPQTNAALKGSLSSRSSTTLLWPSAGKEGCGGCQGSRGTALPQAALLTTMQPGGYDTSHDQGSNALEVENGDASEQPGVPDLRLESTGRGPCPMALPAVPCFVLVLRVQRRRAGRLSIFSRPPPSFRVALGPVDLVVKEPTQTLEETGQMRTGTRAQVMGLRESPCGTTLSSKRDWKACNKRDDGTRTSRSTWGSETGQELGKGVLKLLWAPRCPDL